MGQKEKGDNSMTETTNEQDVNAPGAIASGALHSNRINPCGTVTVTESTAAGETPVVPAPEKAGGADEPKTPGSVRPRTVRAARRGKGARTRKRKLPGVHPARSTFEAADILVREGYFVGLIRGRGAVFDLVGHSPEGSILVRIVRPKAPVANAREICGIYEKDIRAIQPFCRMPPDNIQFWVFSRETGLARYRVFAWGIGNVTTMQKFFKKKTDTASDTKSATTGKPVQRARNSPCPECQTG